MKVIYDPTKDLLQIVFRDAPVEDFSEDRSGLTINYDAEDKIVALEIRNASRLMDDPQALEHRVLS